MQYRRFGKTELNMPVLSCGGMRYQQTWGELDPKDLDAAGQENLEASIRRAVELGINHIETARGYGSSEYQLGKVLPSLPRDKLIVQTKVGPGENEDAFLKTFDTSLSLLKLDYVDLLGVHGINTAELLDQALNGGTLAACRKLQDRGLARHVGFSTHAPPEVVLAAVSSGEFSYVNLHWYYFDQLNWPAIAEARKRDMGVFIISPSEKGGRLFEPPEKLVDLCAPLTPMAFNDLFCLSHPEVNTLSIGAARPSDFDAHLAVLPLLDQADEALAPILARLHEEMCARMGKDWTEHWVEGLPFSVNVPEDFPVYQVLRMYNMAKAYDMVGFGQMRYNLLGSGGHWFPGVKSDKVDWDQLTEAMAGYRFADRIPEIAREAHAMFNKEDAKRLSESDS